MTLATTSNAKTRHDAPIDISTDSLAPAMRDFWAGMRFLHRYAARCHADAKTIGRDNLRLLHANLLADAHYRAMLAEAGRCNSLRGLPVSRKLYDSSEINAEIFSLRQGCTLQLAPHSNQLGLLMVLSGRAVHVAAPSVIHGNPQSFSGKMHRWLRGSNSASAQTLRSEDIVWESSCAPEPQTLTATTDVCVVLRVRLPLSTFSASVDIYRQQPASRMALVG